MPRILGAVRDNSPFSYEVHGPHDSVSAAGVTLIRLLHKRTDGSARALLDDYLARGASAVYQRADDCAVIIYEADKETLLLSRDRIGVHPIHYIVGKHGFYFGTLIADVVRAASIAARPHRSALAAMLVHHSAPPIGHTYFDDVHSLAPAATLRRSADTTRIIEGEARAVTTTAISFADAAAEFGDRFRRAVTARTDHFSQTSVLVSGGLDSAAIISSAPSAFGITYGLHDGSDADESAYVQDLRGGGYPIHEVPFDPMVTFSTIERNVRDGETPAADDVPATLMRAAECARGLGAEGMLIGTWGDQVLAPFPPAHLQGIPPWRVWQLSRIARAFQSSMTDIDRNVIFRALWRQSMRAHLPAVALNVIRRHRRSRETVFDLLLRDFPEHEYTRPPRNYGEAVRQSYSSPEQVEAIEATIKWGIGQELEIGLPFLDAGLVEWLVTLPDDVAYHEGSLKPLLRRAMQGVLPERIRERRDKGDYTAAIRARMLNTREVVDALDRLQRFLDFGLMSEAAARTTLAKLTSKGNISEHEADLAGILLGVDTWLRVFFKAEK